MFLGKNFSYFKSKARRQDNFALINYLVSTQ